jgi:hypothetical protein
MTRASSPRGLVRSYQSGRLQMGSSLPLLNSATHFCDSCVAIADSACRAQKLRLQNGAVPFRCRLPPFILDLRVSLQAWCGITVSPGRGRGRLQWHGYKAP